MLNNCLYLLGHQILSKTSLLTRKLLLFGCVFEDRNLPVMYVRAFWGVCSDDNSANQVDVNGPLYKTGFDQMTMALQKSPPAEIIDQLIVLIWCKFCSEYVCELLVLKMHIFFNDFFCKSSVQQPIK